MLYNTYNRLLLLLLFHLLTDLAFLCCWIWRKMKKKKNKKITRSLSLYDFKIKKKERKKERKRNWHNKNRFRDKIMCLLFYVIHNTYNRLSSLFFCQNGSQCVGRWDEKERKQYKYDVVVVLLLPYVELVQYWVVFLLWVCACVLWYIQKRTKYLIIIKREKKETKKWYNLKTDSNH